MDKNGPDQNSEDATDQPNIGNDTLLTPSVPTHPLSQLPRLRRNLLYTVLCIALSLDALSTSSMFTSTGIIAADIGLAEGGNAIWIVSASAMASAAFIPLGGRLADVLPPRWWFVGGFVGMTGLTLGNSFVKDKKLFLALRSLQGVCAALTLPSGFSMIVHMYPDHAKQRTRLIVTSVIYSMGVACGFIVGGLLVLVNWRWIFRFLAIVACLVSFAGWILIPGQCTLDSANDDFVRDSTKEIIKKLDLIGVFLIMGSLLLFNLALTSATVFSWSNARVIAPLVLSLCLLPAFCIWEAKQDVRYAMLPVAIMKKAKFLVVCFTGMAAETWFSTSPKG